MTEREIKRLSAVVGELAKERAMTAFPFVVRERPGREAKKTHADTESERDARSYFE